jgi:EAL domain-containing protein (putative c-di-GMP-specific phosphodiesterase class I)
MTPGLLKGSKAMSFPVLEDYLKRLPKTANPGQRIWLGEDERVRGKYFNCTLTSVFQPVRRLDSDAASDDESVELDRLCRMLHVLNFFRQAGAARADLYLSVHGRLLAAVDSNHGMVFRRILDSLGLPAQGIVLQLPQATPNQGWLLNYVADNYRRNGFRVAINAADVADGLRLLEQVRPYAIKVDARQVADPASVEALLLKCWALDVELLFKRVESEEVADLLAGLPVQGNPVLVQGYAWDQPKGAIALQSGRAPASEAA